MKTIKIVKLETYDIVGNPGFKNARMEEITDIDFFRNLGYKISVSKNYDRCIGVHDNLGAIVRRNNYDWYYEKYLGMPNRDWISIKPNDNFLLKIRELKLKKLLKKIC